MKCRRARTATSVAKPKTKEPRRIRQLAMVRILCPYTITIHFTDRHCVSYNFTDDPNIVQPVEKPKDYTGLDSDDEIDVTSVYDEDDDLSLLTVLPRILVLSLT